MTIKLNETLLGELPTPCKPVSPSLACAGPGVPWKQGMSTGLAKMLGLSGWCVHLSRSFSILGAPLAAP